MSLKTKDRSKAVIAALRALTDREVLVGIPREKAMRQEGEPINSAALGYIHEFGSPARNIPARPFLHPGVDSIRDEAVKRFAAGARAALGGDSAAMDRAMHAVGLMTQSAVRMIITNGIAPPLSLAALESRLRRHKGRAGLRAEIERRKTGEGPSPDDSTPLVDTGQLRNAIAYVIRERK
jgi:hypothetical protein